MLKDFLRKKEIIERSTSIATEIMNRYPAKLDTAAPTTNKTELKKKERKLIRALQMGKMDINRTMGEMGLGIYGKAKFYQTIKEAMLDQGYTEASIRIIMDELVITL